jgi:2-dehydro-3-deoxygluconokinase
MDLSEVKWIPYDGLGRDDRIGLNFTEVGIGVRPSVTMYDRGHSAASHMSPADVDWTRLFGGRSTRWFHTGGIFAALSDTTPKVVLEAVQAARKHGAIVSYDLNYRPSLWKSIGGQKRAQEVNREIAKYVDVMIGNEEDFTACLGFEVEGADEHLSRIEVTAFKQMIGKAVKAYPNFKVVATTLRAVKTASRNDWGAICWAGGKFYEAPNREDLEILDRVGGGDSFASGLIYGLLRFNDPQKAVEYGAAHGALAMTTPGDASMASLKEVEALVKGGSARVLR